MPVRARNQCFDQFPPYTNLKRCSKKNQERSKKRSGEGDRRQQNIHGYGGATHYTDHHFVALSGNEENHNDHKQQCSIDFSPGHAPEAKTEEELIHKASSPRYIRICFRRTVLQDYLTSQSFNTSRLFSYSDRQHCRAWPRMDRNEQGAFDARIVPGAFFGLAALDRNTTGALTLPAKSLWL